MTASRKRGGGGRSAPKKKGNKKGSKADATAKVSTDEKDEMEIEEPKDVDEHPYALGHALIVNYRDGSERLAKIIERTKAGDNANNNNDDDDNDVWRYYVHYEDFNRRMDEWVDNDRIAKPPSEANPKMEAVEAAAEEAAKRLRDEKAAMEEAEGAGKGGKTGAQRGLTHGAGFGLGQANHHFIRRKTEFEEKVEQARDADGNVVTTIADDEHDEHEGIAEAELKEHEEVTKIKNVSNVRFGKYFMECWYFSPFPKEYFDGKLFIDRLYFCEFSFRFFKTAAELHHYQSKPELPRHPPGNEIYRDPHVSMFELDGSMEKIYCQNLCYFAKLFLDHKTLYLDVDPFLFYVLCRRDDRGFTPVGFFSKEKNSDLGYNLACILAFPCEQRRGYGRFLISFSYELSKKEGKMGSPEKPLSDLGAVSYRSYWASNILTAIKAAKDETLSIADISRRTSIVPEDVLATLQYLKLVQVVNGQYMLVAPEETIDALLKTYPIKPLWCDPRYLVWMPLYVLDPKKDKWNLQSLPSADDQIDNQ